MKLKKSVFMLAITGTVASGVIFSENVHAASPDAENNFVSTLTSEGGSKAQAFLNQARNHLSTHKELTDDAVNRAASTLRTLGAQIRQAYIDGILTKNELADPETLLSALRIKLPGAAALADQIMADIKWGAAQVMDLVSPKTGTSGSPELLKNTGRKQNISTIALFSLVCLALIAFIASRHKEVVRKFAK